MSIGFLTKCVFISSTHVIFDVYIENEFSEAIGEGNVVLDTTFNGDYDFRVRKAYQDSFNSNLPAILERCKVRASKIFNKK